MNNKPLVTLLDIETSPITSYTWRAWQDNALKIIEPSKLMSFSWKTLFAKETHVKCIADYETYSPGVINDELLVKDAWEVLDKSDVIISHHGDSFDLKKLNARFVYYGLSAPSSYQSIDTKKAASKFFRFDSNSLNNLAEYLNLGRKVENGGFSLWNKCISGDPKAWSLMKKYNVGDVKLLEKVYLALRPYMSNHPNLALITDNESETFDSCPTCLSENIARRGFSITKTGKRQRYQCGDCGSWSSGPFQRIKKTSV